MTRCDALKYAAAQMLERFRVLLDGPTAIKSVTLELKITPDGRVMNACLSPEFEAQPIGKPQIEKYIFVQD